MATHHQKAGKNAVPAGNVPGKVSSVAQVKAALGGSRKPAKGRTAKTTKADIHAGPVAKEGNVWQERQTEANRPIGRGGGKRRGDRQDTHPDPGRRNNERSGLRNDRNPTSTAGRRNNRTANQGG